MSDAPQRFGHSGGDSGWRWEKNGVGMGGKEAGPATEIKDGLGKDKEYPVSELSLLSHFPCLFVTFSLSVWLSYYISLFHLISLLSLSMYLDYFFRGSLFLSLYLSLLSFSSLPLCFFLSANFFVFSLSFSHTRSLLMLFDHICYLSISLSSFSQGFPLIFRTLLCCLSTSPSFFLSDCQALLPRTHTLSLSVSLSLFFLHLSHKPSLYFQNPEFFNYDKYTFFDVEKEIVDDGKRNFNQPSILITLTVFINKNWIKN